MLGKVSISHLVNWSLAYRGYNAAVAALVMYQYLNNPQAAALEYLPDVAIHSLEALAPNSLHDVAVVGNMARAVQAGVAFFTGHSTVPSSANLVDVFNHGMNFGYRISQ